ncbi:MAG: CarD family transcriptional regulator [Oscillospiraceae bacterium]|nr:CarD family transcriptional regulator [Oscillospiraceae bacterium]
MFSIGDYVVHPLHGAGQIEDIVEEKVAGVKKKYYVFNMPAGSLVLKIPTSSAGTVGIRNVITESEADELIKAIPGLTVEANSNWNKRYQENLSRLKSGDLYEVAKVIKSLVQRESQRGLSTGERKMLYNAKQIMISEIVLAKRSEYEDVETSLMDAMRKGADHGRRQSVSSPQ